MFLLMEFNPLSYCLNQYRVDAGRPSDTLRDRCLLTKVQYNTPR